MLEYICSILALVVLFFFVSFVLVKLYKHGVRDWFVYVCLVVFGLVYFFSKPKDYVFSNTEQWIAIVVTAACIFTVDSGAPIRLTKPKFKSKATENEPHKKSMFQHFLNALFIYSAWEYFFDEDNEE